MHIPALMAVLFLENITSFQKPVSKKKSNFYVDAYTVGNIQYYWKPYDPVEISDSVEMPKFEAERHISISDCSKNYTSSK